MWQWAMGLLDLVGRQHLPVTDLFPIALYALAAAAGFAQLFSP